MLNIHMIVHKLIEVDSTRKFGNVSASTYIYTYAFLNDVIYTHYFYIRERGSVLYLGMAQECWDFAKLAIA